MSAPAAAAAAASGSLGGAPSSGAELPDQVDSDTDSSSLVDAVQLVQVQRMYARQGLALATSDVGATVPRPEEGETEEEFAASTAPRPGGFRMVAPRITLEQAQAQAQAKRTCGAGAFPGRPRRRLVSVSPEWRAQVLECVREQGFEVAPPDYPLEAAFTMVPDIGLAWIIAATHTHTDTADAQH